MFSDITKIFTYTGVVGSVSHGVHRAFLHAEQHIAGWWVFHSTKKPTKIFAKGKRNHDTMRLVVYFNLYSNWLDSGCVLATCFLQYEADERVVMATKPDMLEVALWWAQTLDMVRGIQFLCPFLDSGAQSKLKLQSFRAMMTTVNHVIFKNLLSL